MYRKVIKDSKPFGAVEAEVVSVSCNGFIAVVQTVETIVPGTELKAAPKKNAPVMKAKVFEHVLSWRVWSLMPVHIQLYSCILNLFASITMSKSTMRCDCEEFQIMHIRSHHISDN
jgi:hypothetical protein